MIIIISGPTHSGKTVLAQRILEEAQIPVLSLDLLKMGLIRSHYTDVSLEDDEGLTQLLWPIVSEMIKTAIENNQHLIIEGIYIPFDWKSSFTQDYLDHIEYFSILLDEDYIHNHFDEILFYRNRIENRDEADADLKDQLLKDNEYFKHNLDKHQLDYLLVKEYYNQELGDIKGEL